ncbi:hypothetical protein BCR44DRAFT_1440141 [Catenaria anguillulae PL171]|uniref:Uncharacterized protein n=1 Tax=Catenaria anguillulae PL171 TaxID=765915 RepID=A0A1Y2HFA2_9FUNG|nr:hypothetical protein BCR44DRAFT_1440141 [Catenaria anguillulae PL171]
MQAIADKFPGLTPWTVAMIGTGVTNFQMFAISLPVLKRIRHHLDVCTMAGKKLPVLVLSSASTLPVLPPNRVLVSDADPFMGPKQLVDFVQLASWIGSPISQWGGVGGTECEAKVRKVLDASSTV